MQPERAKVYALSHLCPTPTQKTPKNGTYGDVRGDCSSPPCHLAVAPYPQCLEVGRLLDFAAGREGRRGMRTRRVEAERIETESGYSMLQPTRLNLERMEVDVRAESGRDECGGWSCRRGVLDAGKSPLGAAAISLRCCRAILTLECWSCPLIRQTDGQNRFNRKPVQIAGRWREERDQENKGLKRDLRQSPFVD